MGHDIDSLIRAKIRHAEGQPVAWERHRVWQAVTPAAESVVRNNRWYRYAAAAILIAALTATLFEVSLRSKRHTLEVPVVGHLQKKSPEPATIAAPSTSTVNFHPKLVNISTRALVLPRETKPAKTEVAVSFPQDKPVALEPVLYQSSVPGVTDSLSRMSESPATVSAIVGFVPAGRPTAVSGRVKGRKLRLWRRRENESEPSPSAEGGFLTARIN